jgi:hypothetical protein
LVGGAGNKKDTERKDGSLLHIYIYIYIYIYAYEDSIVKPPDTVRKREWEHKGGGVLVQSTCEWNCTIICTHVWN